MLFTSKKKNKIDPKVRFQDRQFNQKLDRARQYKRTSKTLPDNKIDKALSRVKLGTRLSQIALGLIVLAALYLVYVPNFLSAKQITVLGLAESDTNVVEAAVHQAIGSAPFYNPQHNLLFLNKDRVRGAALSVPKVFEVQDIKVNYKSNKIIVTATPKYEQFLVADDERVYDIYNDGSIKGIAGVSKEQWGQVSNPGMLKVQLPGIVQLSDSKQFFSVSLTQALKQLVSSAKEIAGSPLVYISLRDSLHEGQAESLETPLPVTLPIVSDEVNAYFQKGTDTNRLFRVAFDEKSNIPEAVERLSVLLMQTAPDRYKNINYIDMRLDNKAFVCLLNSYCER